MKQLLQGICLALLLATLSACDPYSATPSPPPKPELPDGTVRKAMAYLHAKDAAGLKTMFPVDFKNADEAVADWIRMWGGISAADYHVSYKSPGGTTHYNTTIQAKSADGSPVTIPVWLSWKEDHWKIGYFPEQFSSTHRKTNSVVQT